MVKHWCTEANCQLIQQLVIRICLQLVDKLPLIIRYKHVKISRLVAMSSSNLMSPYNYDQQPVDKLEVKALYSN